MKSSRLGKKMEEKRKEARNGIMAKKIRKKEESDAKWAVHAI